MVEDLKKLRIDDAFYETEVPEDFYKKSYSDIKGLFEIRAIIPGTVAEIKIKQGQKITPGQVVLVLEAMKMFNDIEVDVEGEIGEICVKIGDRVSKGQLMIRIK